MTQRTNADRDNKRQHSKPKMAQSKKKQQREPKITERAKDNRESQRRQNLTQMDDNDTINKPDKNLSSDNNSSNVTDLTSLFQFEQYLY